MRIQFSSFSTKQVAFRQEEIITSPKSVVLLIGVHKNLCFRILKNAILMNMCPPSLTVPHRLWPRLHLSSGMFCLGRILGMRSVVSEKALLIPATRMQLISESPLHKSRVLPGITGCGSPCRCVTTPAILRGHSLTLKVLEELLE